MCRKYLLIISFFIFFSWTSSAQYIGQDYCDQWDLMQQAFCIANRNNTVIDLGNTKKAVWNAFIKGSIDIKLLDGIFENRADSVDGKDVWEHLEDFKSSSNVDHRKESLNDALRNLGNVNALKEKDANKILELVNELSGSIEEIASWTTSIFKNSVNSKLTRNLSTVNANRLNEIYSILNKNWKISEDDIKNLKKNFDDVQVIPPVSAPDLIALLTSRIPELGTWNVENFKQIISKKGNNLFQTDDIIRFDRNDSIIIKITRFLLMLTIVLSVTMTIINGIQYIIKSGNGEDPSKLRMNILYIVIGILVALFSVVIVNLFRSVGETTLKELWYNEYTIETKYSNLV